MKPYPLASLNHFTFPLAIARCLQRSESNLRFGCRARHSTCGAYIGTPCTFVKKTDMPAGVAPCDSPQRRLLPPPARSYVRAVPKENLIGQTIAGYTLRNEVGEGGTSAVFRAEHP